MMTNLVPVRNGPLVSIQSAYRLYLICRSSSIISSFSPFHLSRWLRPFFHRCSSLSDVVPSSINSFSRRVSLCHRRSHSRARNTRTRCECTTTYAIAIPMILSALQMFQVVVVLAIRWSSIKEKRRRPKKKEQVLSSVFLHAVGAISH